MPTDDDLIDQADMLMRRYRSFVARPAEQPKTPDTPAELEQNAADYDIPVLTEIIDAQATYDQNVSAILASLRGDIESEISAWLVNELPASVANASQQILDELDSKARNTLLPRLNTLIETHRANQADTGDTPPSN
jgi:hypothetical protein